MHRAFRLFAVATAGLALSTAAAFAQSTTRIETRPYYGATVTLEAGVRVFRPLPPEDRVIINPEGKTPLSLGFNDTRIYERRVIKNYNYNEGGPSSAPRDVVGGYYSYGSPYGYYRGNRYNRPGYLGGGYPSGGRPHGFGVHGVR